MLEVGLLGMVKVVLEVVASDVVLVEHCLRMMSKDWRSSTLRLLDVLLTLWFLQL